MSKTAEEILNEHFAKSVPTNTPMWDSAVNAANEFAAQEVAKEVEAYKDRLRAALKELPAGLVNRERFHKLIDTVK